MKRLHTKPNKKSQYYQFHVNGKLSQIFSQNIWRRYMEIELHGAHMKHIAQLYAFDG